MCIWKAESVIPVQESVSCFQIFSGECLQTVLKTLWTYLNNCKTKYTLCYSQR